MFDDVPVTDTNYVFIRQSIIKAIEDVYRIEDPSIPLAVDRVYKPRISSYLWVSEACVQVFECFPETLVGRKHDIILDDDMPDVYDDVLVELTDEVFNTLDSE